jgi:large subunit ribosomal protein L16
MAGNIFPSRTKYKKVQKGRIRKGIGRNKGCTIVFGDFAIQSISCKQISSHQIESARVVINRYLKRKGKVWMRIFPQKPITKKPAETRMGKGKGNVEYWASIVYKGTILFEISGVKRSVAKEAFRLADGKLSCKCRFLERNNNF